ncbi:hypothetical protein BC833DRAFT_599845 [Globomyces pollinis-pini]|nr:hypothetical protein BC833DRAFT_599845 [Globomyces pollinis-pini]
MFEFVFYNLFLVTMESVLLLRGIAFTRYDKYLKYVTVALWVIRLCIGGYQVSTIVSISEVNDYCVFSADFSVSIHQLWLQILTEVILLLPFLEKMYQMIQSATATGISGDGNRKELLHLSIHNTFCTALVIAAQIASTYINGIPGMAPYINAVFAIVDAVQALAVMNAMDVLKNTFINMSNSSRNRNQTPVHSSGYQLSQSNECD